MHRLLTDHPATVGETYGEHWCSAWGFGLRLIVAGLACCVHGLLPFLCVTTGSRTVTMLHQRMVVERSKRLQQQSSAEQTH
jgi:hypothetical protein